MKSFIPFIFLLLCTYFAQSQFSVAFPKDWPVRYKAYKDGTTYLVVKNKENPELTTYLEVFRAAWTFNKLEVINATDLPKYYALNNLFLDLETDRMMSSAAVGVNRTNYTFIKPVIRLWGIEDKFFTKKKKVEDIDKYTFNVAEYNIHVSFNSAYDNQYNSNIATPNNDLNGNKDFLFWGPGVFKSVVTTFNFYLNNNKEKFLYSMGAYDKNQLPELKSKKLFLADNILWEQTHLVGHRFDKTLKIEKLMKNYQFPYELLTVEQLDQKLLTNEDFYYLHHIQTKDQVFITVINAKTGEIIYSDYDGRYNLKPGDFSSLASKIRK